MEGGEGGLARGICEDGVGWAKVGCCSEGVSVERGGEG